MKDLTYITIEPELEAQACMIWLHGLGAEGNDLVPIAEALNLPNQRHIRFIFPHAPKRPISLNDGMIMRAWFDISSIRWEGPFDTDGIIEATNLITQLVAEQEKSGIESENIVIGGFSMGGCIALNAGLIYPNLLGGLIGLSTFLRVDLLHEHIQPAPRPPVFLGHGEQDPLVPASFLGHMEKQFAQQHLELESHLYPGLSHSVHAKEIADIRQWLMKHWQTAN